MLEIVGLQNCKFLTDDSVLSLTSSLSCDTLRSLNLRGVAALTNASVESFVAARPSHPSISNFATK